MSGLGICAAVNVCTGKGSYGPEATVLPLPSAVWRAALPQVRFEPSRHPKALAVDTLNRSISYETHRFVVMYCLCIA